VLLLFFSASQYLQSDKDLDPKKKRNTPTHPVGEDDERGVLVKLWVR
jgi:hypothetical protein